MNRKIKSHTILNLAIFRNRNVQRIVIFCFKIILSALAILFVVNRLDFQRFFRILEQVKMLPAIPAIVFFVLSKLFSVIRTDALIRNTGIKMSFHATIKLYWIGMFYNQFLPGGVGGDAYKVALLKHRKSVQLRHGAGIMINDRVSGFVVLLILVVLMYYVVQFDSRLDLVLWLLMPLSLFGYLFFLRRFYGSVTKIFPLLMLYSLCVQIMQFVVIIFLMLSLGYQEHYLSYLFIFGVSSVASNLPISVGGIGIREMVFFTGAQYLNLVPEHAVFISITFYLISFVVSIPGIIWVFHSPFQVRNAEDVNSNLISKS